MANWDPESDRRRVECIQIGAAEVRAGNRVRLRPQGRADILDIALTGKLATIEAIEQDLEGRIYLAVTVDDDPGADLGALRQPGHRFFFLPTDVEALSLGEPFPARFRLDPNRGRLTVQAFATGMLSKLGHSPTFAARDFAGLVTLDGQKGEGLALELTIQADSLELLDRVSAADRAEIERRMRREVLESAAFPEIAYRTVESEVESADQVSSRVFLGGQLTLHGVTQRIGIETELWVDSETLRLKGGYSLRMSSYRIRPVTALAGAIRLKDELSVSFDIVAAMEERR